MNQEGEPVSQEEYDRLGQWAWEGISREQINQWRASDKNPGDTLDDDASCFLAFLRTDQLARQALGFPVPLIGTEGGPVVGWKEDRRYPRTTPDMHRDRITQIAEYMQGTRQIHYQNCPNNFFAMCHWLMANYRLGFIAPGWESQSWYSDWWNKDFNLNGELPIVAALKALPSVPVDGTGGASIAGIVTRADTDEPLADLTVQLLRANTEISKTQTKADGSFTFNGLAAGTYDIAIAPWGVVRRGISADEQGGQLIRIRVTGGRASILTGTVQNPSGATIAGIEVSLRRDGQAVATNKTGADGSFRFEGLTLGTYRLSVPGITVDGIALDGWQAKSIKLTRGTAAGYRYEVAEKRLLPAEETNNRRIFYGIVTDASGAPLNGIKVQMSWEGAAGGTQFPVKVTGSDAYKPAGYYEFLHTPGKFALEVIQGDWPGDKADGLDTANVPGREGQPVCYEVNFQLRPVSSSPAQVDGVIYGGQAGRKVTLTGVAGSGATPPTRQTVLAANGAFAFPSVADGAYRLSLEGIGVISQDISVSPGTLFRVLFSLRSQLSGTAVGAPEGLVAVLFSPETWAWTRQFPLDPQGAFTFQNLPPGLYRLEVGEQAFSDLALTGENRLVLPAIDLMAGKRSVIRGRVADGEGQPKADRIVTLRRDNIVVAEARTAADGTYRFASLPPGAYVVEVAGLGQITSSIQLDGEREQAADGLWPSQGPRGTLQGRVRDANGAVVPYAIVHLLKDGAEVAGDEADSKGVFRFAGLTAGTYAIAVSDGKAVVDDIVLPEDATVVRDITLPPGPAKLLSHYLLFAPPPAANQKGHAEARLLLALATHYLTGDLSGGFSIDEAKLADRVTIIGDRVPTSAENILSAAGCQVARLQGDVYAVAAALEQLFAEG